VWRTSPSDALQAKAVGGLVTQLEPRARTAAGLMASDPITLAIASKGDGYGRGLRDELVATMRFNGMAAVEVQDTYFTRTDYGDPDDPANTDPAARYAASITAVVSQAPHIVILVGTNEGVTQIFAGVEAQWPTGTTTYRPFWIFTDGGQIPELLSAVDGKDELRRRVFGSVPGTNDSNLLYRRFLDSYESVFNDGTEPRVFGTAGAYDAAYLIAFAAASLGDRPLTGANLSQGLKQLTGGAQQIELGPRDIGAGFTALTSNPDARINVAGASGPLDFDVTFGEAPSDIQTWCITTSGGLRYFFTGYFYNAVSGQMEGSLTCP